VELVVSLIAVSRYGWLGLALTIFPGPSWVASRLSEPPTCVVCRSLRWRGNHERERGNHYESRGSRSLPDRLPEAPIALLEAEG